MKNIHAVVITWRHHKNQQNEQKIRLQVDRDHPEICPAIAIANMVLRKAKLKHDIKLPHAIFQAKDGTVQYLTHSKVTEIIRKAMKTVYPDISKEERMMYSCHSIRVWPCVYLP